jgi:hypothetical protein
VKHLVEAFGAEIADIVGEVTDDKSLPKAERKRAQIEHARHLSQRAKLVKLADKICNLRDMSDCSPADWPIERRRHVGSFNRPREVIPEATYHFQAGATARRSNAARRGVHSTDAPT